MGDHYESMASVAMRKNKYHVNVINLVAVAGAVVKSKALYYYI